MNEEQMKYLWDIKVNTLARKCIDVEIMHTLTNINESNKDGLNKFINDRGVHDVRAMNNVSQMMWAVEHDLADDRLYKIALDIANVHATLNSDSYWKNVWNDDLSSSEARNLKNLAIGLNEMMTGKVQPLLDVIDDMTPRDVNDVLEKIVSGKE